MSLLQPGNSACAARPLWTPCFARRRVCVEPCGVLSQLPRRDDREQRSTSTVAKWYNEKKNPNSSKIASDPRTSVHGYGYGRIRVRIDVEGFPRKFFPNTPGFALQNRHCAHPPCPSSSHPIRRTQTPANWRARLTRLTKAPPTLPGGMAGRDLENAFPHGGPRSHRPRS